MKNSWRVTEYNSFEINDVFNSNPWHVWIQPRQNYCDRGHWDWGNTGMGNFSRNPEPSYYYMSLHTALLELEEYVFRVNNGFPSPTRTRSTPDFDTNAWIFKKSDGTYNHMRNTPQGGVIVTVTPEESPTGQVWVAEIEGIESLDHSDAFPRVYLHKEAALSEMERFLKWRLEKVPFESTYDRAEYSRNQMETHGSDSTLVYGEHLQNMITTPTVAKTKSQVVV